MKYYGAAPIAEAAPYILLPEYQYYKSGVIYSGMNKVFPSTLRSPLWMMYGVCRQESNFLQNLFSEEVVYL